MIQTTRSFKSSLAHDRKRPTREGERMTSMMPIDDATITSYFARPSFDSSASIYREEGDDDDDSRGTIHSSDNGIESLSRSQSSIEDSLPKINRVDKRAGNNIARESLISSSKGSLLTHDEEGTEYCRGGMNQFEVREENESDLDYREDTFRLSTLPDDAIARASTDSHRIGIEEYPRISIDSSGSSTHWRSNLDAVVRNVALGGENRILQGPDHGDQLAVNCESHRNKSAEAVRRMKSLLGPKIRMVSPAPWDDPSVLEEEDEDQPPISPSALRKTLADAAIQKENVKPAFVGVKILNRLTGRGGNPNGLVVETGPAAESIYRVQSPPLKSPTRTNPSTSPSRPATSFLSMSSSPSRKFASNAQSSSPPPVPPLPSSPSTMFRSYRATPKSAPATVSTFVVAERERSLRPSSSHHPFDHTSQRSAESIPSLVSTSSLTPTPSAFANSGGNTSMFSSESISVSDEIRQRAERVAAAQRERAAFGTIDPEMLREMVVASPPTSPRKSLPTKKSGFFKRMMGGGGGSGSVQEEYISFTQELRSEPIVRVSLFDAPPLQQNIDVPTRYQSNSNSLAPQSLSLRPVSMGFTAGLPTHFLNTSPTQPPKAVSNFLVPASPVVSPPSSPVAISYPSSVNRNTSSSSSARTPSSVSDIATPSTPGTEEFVELEIDDSMLTRMELKDSFAIAKKEWREEKRQLEMEVTALKIELLEKFSNGNSTTSERSGRVSRLFLFFSLSFFRISLSCSR